MNKEYATIQSGQELKKLYRAGTITAAEYEAYKKRLIYGIAIPIKPGPSTPTPAGSPASSFSGKSTEIKISYPAKSKEVKLSTAAEPGTGINHNDAKLLQGVDFNRRKKLLLVSLTAVGILSVLNVLVYWYLNNSTPERLTQKPKAEVEKVVATNLPQENLPVSSLKTDLERAPLVSSGRNMTTRPKAGSVNRRSSAASPSRTDILTNKKEILKKAQQHLKAYYTDMQAPPLKASDYFAPQVDRYYTLSNTTPVAITKNINSYHFSEFLRGQTIIQEGSMKLVNASNNGYELTYLEDGSAFRKSKNLRQEVKARVRVRFDTNFKITYFRQERLLQNRFVKE